MWKHGITFTPCVNHPCPPDSYAYSTSADLSRCWGRGPLHAALGWCPQCILQAPQTSASRKHRSPDHEFCSGSNLGFQSATYMAINDYKEDDDQYHHNHNKEQQRPLQCRRRMTKATSAFLGDDDDDTDTNDYENAADTWLIKRQSNHGAAMQYTKNSLPTNWIPSLG